ncbi:MAG: patatin-like phospholipase family protein [Elusimicrobia bacterium]|nr:patatin-like phospholipase family protein [Elusimicrobiota bacterium]
MSKAPGRVLALVSLLVFSGVAGGLEISPESVLRDFLWQEWVGLAEDSRPRIGLALGSGGGRGLAHLGVLEVLEREGVPVDVLAGTSIGAVVGAFYAAGFSLGQMRDLASQAGWEDATDVSRARVLKLILADSLLSTERLEKLLREKMGDLYFHQLKVPFACVATDIRTGERIVFREGEVAPAVRASMTLPGLFKPVQYRHRFLVDGGIVEGIPVETARVLGADWVIASYTAYDFTRSDFSNVLKTLDQALNIRGGLADVPLLEQADFVIRPEVGHIHTFELWRSEEAMEEGVRAAHGRVPALKDQLILRFADRLLARWMRLEAKKP